MRRHWLLRVCPAVFSAVLLLGVGGCQMFHSDAAALLSDDTHRPPGEVAPTSDAAIYYVEFRPDGRKPTLIPRQLTDVTRVQEALEQAGAAKRFRRIKVEVYRHLPEGGGHKFPVKYDRHKRRVDPASDYTIHPQDRIVVTEDTSTVLDDMLEKLGVPTSNPIGG